MFCCLIVLKLVPVTLFVMCFSVQGMKVRSISLSFRHHPKTLVFMDAQSQMNMGQIQQTVFLVQIVCILLLYILHEITVFHWIIEPQPASLCLLSHLVSVLSGMSLREDLGGKMRVVMCRLFFFPLSMSKCFIDGILTLFCMQLEKKSKWHPWYSTGVWLILVCGVANSLAV